MPASCSAAESPTRWLEDDTHDSGSFHRRFDDDGRGLVGLILRGEAFSAAPLVIALQVGAAALMVAVCMFAWACFLGHLSWFALGMAAAVSAGSVVRMLAEEKLLLARYPEYIEYARKTKRMVPHLF